jgi:hypothetical protein
MDKVFRNPMFITGVPLVICGFGVGLNDLLRGATFSYIALGLLIPGLALMLIGWIRRDK